MINKVLFLLIIFSLALTGCIQTKSSTGTGAIDGGVFRSIDKGATWQQKVLIPTAGRPGNFSGANIMTWVMDPQDSQAIYYAGIGAGLFYTYDGANTWRKAGELGNNTIRAIGVDPFDKCTIFITIGNRVFKSDDCSRTWKQMYFDNQTKITINALALDHFNENHLYIGLSRGDLVKSLDAGESWQTVHRFNARIDKLLIDPDDSRVMYALVSKKGVFKSSDQGENWESFNDGLKEHKLGTAVKDLILFKDNPTMIFIATNLGIVRSSDAGETWEQIELIPAEKKTALNALAVNPKDTKEIFYVTNNTFFRSSDGGENWQTIKLNTSRAGRTLLINPNKPEIMYLGVRALPKK
ncbi:hypothetical protein KAJ89_06090 [Candidatus Parcubacteria bacterium]|nr:hypothetical protein [Candidatus Parcubacteria bacterium]